LEQLRPVRQDLIRIFAGLAAIGYLIDHQVLIHQQKGHSPHANHDAQKLKVLKPSGPTPNGPLNGNKHGNISHPPMNYYLGYVIISLFCGYDGAQRP
jgi:hypothetical protein